ncbi:thyroglobulin-like isoform X2 [Aricia agestis]|uniref:thyroglobulin-like isoform X2 n=1 Tax=Aricia agestis TaxID=91739 RepID=UPI001C2084BC|nr:thyroglobulin-like isoform X2 [Aricia agestis]
MAAKTVALFIYFLLLFVYVKCDILCQNGYCQDYLLDPGCASTAAECRINNATHAGIWLPSPTTCNCCELCLPLYGAGSDCSRGGPGVGSTVGRCGHGLYCDADTLKCVRMKSKCHDAQDDYDARHERGETGALETRPYCDGKGNFAPFHCIPTQTCFCQSDEGERLFGEVPYRSATQNMPCGCSRMHEKITKQIEPGVPYPVIAPRCTSDGNFNPVQCLNRTCYCVNKITGEAIDHHTIDLDEEPISKLPCYDAELDLFPSQSQGNPPYNHTTPCYLSIDERKALIIQSIEEGFNVDFFSTFNSIRCLPDGTYGRIYRNANGSKICGDERGIRIGNYEAAPSTPEYDTMNCKCALALSLMESSYEPPRCCKNGNFRSVQCRRGQCRCVDDDGRQVGTETSDVTSLPCYTANWKEC